MGIKVKKIIFAIGFLAIYAIFLYFQGNSSVFANETLNNELLAWGFRRGENHSQATLDTKSEAIIRQYNGMSMGNEESKKIYLTFDCGYEAGYTKSILEVLKENDVKATFFITGHYLNTADDLVKQMIQDGHIVGNHTVNHKCLPEISNEEIEKEIMKLHSVVYEKFGYEMLYFRPPKGEFSQRVIDKVTDLGYTTVMWSSAYDDWDNNKQGRTEYGKKKIIDNIHNGCILLLHATSEDNSKILGDVIKEIKDMGYEFSSLDEFER